MSTARVDLQGIFPPIPTPFDACGEVDLGALGAHLDFLGAYDLRGYVVMGSNGEAVHLSFRERVQLLESARAAIPEDRLLIAGTGCHSTRQTVDLSTHAADTGADAVLVLPPHYYKSRMTIDALVRHFHTVADACECPVILYNMPACTGMDMNADTILAIADHPRVIGLKDSGGDVAKLGMLHHKLGAKFQILAGSASFLLPALCIGAVGGVLALANIAPDQCRAIHELSLSGDITTARAIQVRLIEANAAVTKNWGVAGLKAAMKLLGLRGGHVRSPLSELDHPDDIQLLRSILLEAGILKLEG